MYYHKYVFPTRLSPEEIEADPNITSYVVLPRPGSAAESLFEEIGRSHFRKYILGEYAKLFRVNSFANNNYTNTPFVISRDCTEPIIVHKGIQAQKPPQLQTQSQSQSAPMNQIMELHQDGNFYAPSHRK